MNKPKIEPGPSPSPGPKPTPTLRTAAIAALDALRSYQHGNKSPVLAEAVADSLETALRNFQGVDDPFPDPFSSSSSSWSSSSPINTGAGRDHSPDPPS